MLKKDVGQFLDRHALSFRLLYSRCWEDESFASSRRSSCPASRINSSSWWRLMEINDFSTLVAQSLASYQGELPSQTIQRTLDNIGELYQVDPYKQDLYHQVVEEIARQEQHNQDFRRGLSLFQAGPDGSQSIDQYQAVSGTSTGEAMFQNMLERSNTSRSKLDRAYFFASKQRYEECARLLVELDRESSGGGGKGNSGGGYFNGGSFDSDNPEVAFLLGQLFLFGKGVPQDLGRGFQLICSAAQNRYMPAFFDCGFCHYQGWGTCPDSRAAEHWLNESLNKASNPQAAVILGGMWQENETTLYSLDKIIELLALAINNLMQNPYKASSSWLGQAYYVLGRIMSEHKDDHATALLHLTISAELGRMEGQNALGYAYFHGLGCPADELQAAYWWNEACTQNCPEACWHLGLMYGQGDAVEADFAKAKNLIGIAARSGRVPDAETLYKQLDGQEES